MKKLILTLSIILLLISSCSNTNKLPGSNTEIFKGTNGVNINFIVNAPPTYIYEEQPFRVGINMHNLGASHDAQGYLVLGYEEDYLEIDDTSKINFNLEGRKSNNIYGESNKQFFDFYSKKIDSMSTHHLTTIYATACYKFKTEASTKVCVDTDLYNEYQSKKICDVEDISLSSQGAPVAVKKIEQDIIPISDQKVKPIFKIHIQNVGNGKVLYENSINKFCGGGALTRKEDLGIIDIKAKLGDYELTCQPKPLQLTLDRDYVRCTLEEGINKNIVTYESFLQITLEYGYTTTISRTVDIKSINDY